MAFFFTTPNSTSKPERGVEIDGLVSQPAARGRRTGPTSGSDSRMVNGCTRLSNCEARMMYIRTTESRKAQRNSVNVVSSSRARPETRVE